MHTINLNKSPIQFRAMCKSCSKQMRCLVCGKSLFGSVWPPSRGLRSSSLRCGNCDKEYGWIKDKSNDISITENGNMIDCSKCNVPFKVVQRVAKIKNKKTIRCFPIKILMRNF